MRAAPKYQHTQIGWVIIVSLVVCIAVVTPPLVRAELWILLAALTALLGGLALVFGTLTVSADDDELRVRFGVGLVRRRFVLADIRTFRPVRNHWYYGWGIRLLPSGTLYNVSGLSAVELIFKNGRRTRIGTDEPAKLVGVLTNALGAPDPNIAQELPVPRRFRLIYVVAAGFTVLLVGAVGVQIYLESREPTVEISESALSVHAFLYGVDVPLQDITGVSLEQNLPKILVRTNGLGLGSTLRGHFKLEKLGKGQLFKSIVCRVTWASVTLPSWLLTPRSISPGQPGSASISRSRPANAQSFTSNPAPGRPPLTSRSWWPETSPPCC